MIETFSHIFYYKNVMKFGEYEFQEFISNHYEYEEIIRGTLCIFPNTPWQLNFKYIHSDLTFQNLLGLQKLILWLAHFNITGLAVDL